MAGRDGGDANSCNASCFSLTLYPLVGGANPPLRISWAPPTPTSAPAPSPHFSACRPASAARETPRTTPARQHPLRRRRLQVLSMNDDLCEAPTGTDFKPGRRQRLLATVVVSRGQRAAGEPRRREGARQTPASVTASFTTPSAPKRHRGRRLVQRPCARVTRSSAARPSRSCSLHADASVLRPLTQISRCSSRPRRREAGVCTRPFSDATR